jgi:hypothetical protein
MASKLSRRKDEERKQFCISRGIKLSDHCCLDMAWFCSKPIEWESQGANPVIMYIAQWREYLIEISREGNSATPIFYCPWCACKLPGSLRDRWYKTLYEKGYNDPGEQEIPAEFNSDKWWKESGI